VGRQTGWQAWAGQAEASGERASLTRCGQFVTRLLLGFFSTLATLRVKSQAREEKKPTISLARPPRGGSQFKVKELSFPRLCWQLVACSDCSLTDLCSSTLGRDSGLRDVQVRYLGRGEAAGEAGRLGAAG